MLATSSLLVLATLSLVVHTSATSSLLALAFFSDLVAFHARHIVVLKARFAAISKQGWKGLTP